MLSVLLGAIRCARSDSSTECVLPGAAKCCQTAPWQPVGMESPVLPCSFHPRVFLCCLAACIHFMRPCCLSACIRCVLVLLQPLLQAQQSTLGCEACLKTGVTLGCWWRLGDHRVSASLWVHQLWYRTPPPPILAFLLDAFLTFFSCLFTLSWPGILQ